MKNYNRHLKILCLWGILFLPIVCSAGGIEIVSGGKIVVSDAGTISIADGGFTNNGTFTAGSGTVTFSGTGTSSYDIAGSSTTFYNLKIDSTTITRINTTVAATNLTIQPSAKLTLVTGKSLTASTSFTIKSNANGTGSFVDEGGTVSLASPTVEQYLSYGSATGPTYRYWYLSTPVAAGNSSAILKGNVSGSYKFWTFSEANQPNPYTAATSGSLGSFATVGQGYVAMVISDRTVTFSGTLNTGNQSVTLTNNGNAQYGGFNLIGNPFPSYLNWESVATTDVSTAWFRTFNNTSRLMAFDTYNGISKSGTFNNGNYNSKFITPMQAFWVKTSSNVSLSLPNSARSHTDNSNVRLRDAQIDSRSLLRLDVSNSIISDEILIGFDENARDNYEAYDSPKMTNDNVDIPEIYTLSENKELVINFMQPFESSKFIPLGFRTGKEGSFKIKAKEIQNFGDETTVILKDKLLNFETDLKKNPEYSFTSSVVNNANRFEVSIRKNPTGLDKIEETSFDVVSANTGSLQIIIRNNDNRNTVVKIFDIQGRLIYSESAKSEIVNVNLNTEPGVYFVIVNDETFNGIKKVIIH